MAWDSYLWTWLRRHEPLPASLSLSEIKAATAERGDPSKFLRGLYTNRVQNDCEQNQKFIRIRTTEKFYYAVLDYDVGVAHGELTRIVRMKWQANNVIHAYPITESELIDELRTYNKEEFSRYQDGV